jgi:signal transduction histidine kinase
MDLERKADVNPRTGKIFLEQKLKIYAYTDRLFVGLMIFQWIGGIVLALLVSPKAWAGEVSRVHIHVGAAVFLGGLIALLPVWMGIFRAGETATRYVIAAAQMLFSALLIHLTGGRIETHFHVFGSLAFLAFYRDWKVLIPATLVVAVDHWIRGVFWPASVYGVVVAGPWRWVEHTAWVLFEDIFLILSCRQSVREMKSLAEQRAQLEANYQIVEEKVIHRTAELIKSNQELEAEIDERKRLEIAVVQSEKLAAVGHLAAEIAHEINSPAAFVHSNLDILEKQMKQYSKLFKTVDELKEALTAGNTGQVKEALDH